MFNPFELFSLPVSFQLDLAMLSQQYLQLQKQLHPDNFAAASEQEQRLALQKSTQVNDAYQILKDPILRAEAILSLALQKPVDNENTTHDLVFLMQQMELREQLEEVETQQDEQKLADLQQKTTASYQQNIAVLAEKIAQQDWAGTKQTIDRLKFIKKLQQEIERLEEKLFDF
ncbi:co-chaperone HscB [Gallibacterium salpingitidis]|uniref:Fe-S protein assembly co-chaperone HscB n=1 Tax=Gallibacterium salpingitidis TaxID=505341 RepID=UPI000804DAD9|nr:Fe-S protein assembly co-chaperone HscB [Gallibacterium salpingitidis]OBX08508.1 co-chaperone HscB [Gallibacterium salpingitidis]